MVEDQPVLQSWQPSLSSWQQGARTSASGRRVVSAVRRGGGRTKLVLKAFTAAIALASVIAAAVVVAANTAAAVLRRWLVVVSSTPSSATRSVIRRFHHCAIVNTFAAGCRHLSPTFTSRCSIALVPAIHHLRHSHRWLVVAFSARPAAYPLNHQAENVFMFPHKGFFLTY